MVSIIIMPGKNKIAEANNYTDTSFNGYYTGYNMVTTDYREKEDESSSYIYNSNSPCGVYVSVRGASGKFVLYRDERGLVFEKFDGQDRICDYSGPVLVGKGQSKKLLNHVNENPDYLNAAQLRMTGTLLRVYLSGVWSPDSI